MSPENVEIARRGIEAVNRKPEPDWATINEVYHADHEFISALDALEAEKHRGARGYRDWLLNTQDTIETESRLEQITEIDKDRVLAIIPTSIRGKSSGVALKEERWASIATVRGGKSG